MSYFGNLVSFMQAINANINWNNVLNELMNRPIEKIFSKLKTYLWSDKDLNVANDLDPVSKRTFLYYTKMLCYLEEKLIDDNVGVVIIGEPKTLSINLKQNDVINEKIRIKFKVLKQMLDFKLIDYVVVDNENVSNIASELNRYKQLLVFPTCSIMYDKPNEIVDAVGHNIVLVNDGYYNIYNTPAELEFNMIRLLIVELINDPSMEITELLSKKYGMLKYDIQNLQV